jgi:hypothetical protein
MPRLGGVRAKSRAVFRAVARRPSARLVGLTIALRSLVKIWDEPDLARLTRGQHGEVSHRVGLEDLSASWFTTPDYHQLEWNFVVEIVSSGCAGHRGLAFSCHRPGCAEIRARTGHIALVRRPACPARSGAVEHGELTVELQHNFGRIAVLSGLVLPLIRPQ